MPLPIVFIKNWLKNTLSKFNIILDNWPIYYHPDLLAALQTQDCSFKLHVPTSWQNLKVSKRYHNKNLSIKLLPLPTYAYWLNVIEKLWRKLKQELLHIHAFKDQFDQLKQKLKIWLDKYTSHQNHGKLRKYVGLMKFTPKTKERLFNES